MRQEARMSGTEKSRLKLLYLLQLLQEESDDEQGVTMRRILGHLEKQGIPAERKSIYRDIETLKDFGYEIEKTKTRSPEYRLLNRTFDIAELKLLVDAIQSAHFIPQKMTDTLIRKLESQTSRVRAVELRRQIHYAGRVKSDNDHIYYTTSTLHDAINHNTRVTFTYIEHNIDKGTQARRAGASYEISPYGLVWNDDKYYVVGYYERYSKVCNFRIDRMKSVSNTLIANIPPPEEFDIDNYIKNEFGMYTGETVTLDIRLTNNLINPLMDRFGTSTPVHRDGSDHIIAHVQAAISPVFYSWLFQFGENVQIVKPARIAEEYKKMVREVMEGMG